MFRVILQGGLVGAWVLPWVSPWQPLLLALFPVLRV